MGPKFFVGVVVVLLLLLYWYLPWYLFVVVNFHKGTGHGLQQKQLVNVDLILQFLLLLSWWYFAGVLGNEWRGDLERVRTGQGVGYYRYS